MQAAVVVGGRIRRAGGAGMVQAAQSVILEFAVCAAWDITHSVIAPF